MRRKDDYEQNNIKFGKKIMELPLLKKRPLITIITPTYNCETLIGTCVRSILEQTFQNFELLIIDGLSTDGTVEKVKRIQKEDNRVKLLSESDKGIYDAMNKGVSLANGKWIYFLGADDRLYNKDILKNVSFSLIKEKVDFLYGNVFFESLNRTYGGLFSWEKFRKYNICHQAIFCKKYIIEKEGNFNLKYQLYADYDFNLKVFLSQRYQIKYIDLIIAYYGGRGISSKNIDEVFLKDLEENFLKYSSNYYKLKLRSKKFLNKIKQNVKKHLNN